MPRKLTIEEVKERFKSYGLTLLDDTYISNSTPMHYLCSNGHTGTVTVGGLGRAEPCFRCAMDRRKLEFGFIKEQFANEGYTVISKTYANSKEKIGYVCPKGHRSSITWSDFKNGYRCIFCAGKNKKTIEEIKVAFLEEGYTLLADSYSNNREKLAYICPGGHKHKISWHEFSTGNRCPYCSGKYKRSYHEIKEQFAVDGYELLSSEYINSHEYLEYVCQNGHRHHIKGYHFTQGGRCPDCFASAFRSRAEEELYIFIRSILRYKHIYCNARNIIPPKELDVYIPSKKLAIEYCGLYWHSEVSGGKNKKYHREKYDLCNEKGIRLLTIFEDEYLDKPDVVRSRIRNALGLVDRRVYARKTEFKHISKQQAQEFLYETHIQGYSPCRYRFGIFYDDKLVQVMTFGTVSRAHASGRGMWEMKRLASSLDVSVIGGVSKLLKNAIVFMKTSGEEVKIIKSYCDLRWASSNTVYESLGFRKVSETKYTPHYVKNGNRYRNQSLAKTEEERLLGKTEWELRHAQGYDRIWDCGHSTYIYEVR